MNARTREQGLKVLDGMREITRAEMLMYGDYISDYVDPRRSGAVCRGHRACLIGSAYLSGGVAPEQMGHRNWNLPGTGTYERQEFLAHRHGLRVAIEALDKAAARKIARLSSHRQRRIRGFGGADEIGAKAEGLFEIGKLGRTDMLRLISSARRDLVNA